MMTQTARPSGTEHDGMGRTSIVGLSSMQTETARPSHAEHGDLWDAVPQHQRAVFQDVEATKKKLRAQLSKPEYNVSMYYRERGIAQKIARSSLFEHVTLSVIMLNALWISVDIDLNPSEVLARAPVGFQIVEQLFCFFFVFEWATRFMAFKRKIYGLRDAWFVFDTVLTIMFVIDAWFMYLFMKIDGGSSGQGLGDASLLRIVRLVRLTRMAKMAHILRAMPELSILLKGLVAAIRSVWFTLMMLAGILYIFAIVFRLFCNEEEQFCKDRFSSVPESMHTLLIHGTLMDNFGSLVYTMQSYNPALIILLYMFVILTAVTIMNQLIGILCEVVNNTAEVEREALSVNYVKHKLQAIMLRAGKSKVFKGEAKINKAEFLEMIHNRAAAAVLTEVGVDAVGLVDFADFIFKDDLHDLMDLEDTDEDEKLLSFADFVEVILKLRGNNNATVKDIIDLRKFVQLKFANIEAKLDAIAGRSKSRKTTLNNTNGSPMPLGEAPLTWMGRIGSFQDGQDLDKASSLRYLTDGADEVGRGSTVETFANRKDAAGNFRHLAQSLVLEHESALANMQRQSERLQAELDVLKSSSSPFPTADCKAEEDISGQPGWLQHVADESSCMLHQADSISRSAWGRDINNRKVVDGCFVLPLPLSNDSSDRVGGSLATQTQIHFAPIPTAPSPRTLSPNSDSLHHASDEKILPSAILVNETPQG